MADVIGSRKNNKKTARDLKLLAAEVNKKKQKQILSPLTITLGDEFQAVVTGPAAGIEVILYTEEFCIRQTTGLKLRYVLLSGEIETPINRRVAYGMLGPGLTQARETLTLLKKSEERFCFVTGNKNDIINKLFILFQGIVDDWKQKDHKIISSFIRLNDYKAVAEENRRTPNSMWKKRKSLKIKEYNAIKSLIQDYALV